PPLLVPVNVRLLNAGMACPAAVRPLRASHCCPGEGSALAVGVSADSREDENGAGGGAALEVGGERYGAGGVPGGAAEGEEGSAAGCGTTEPGEGFDRRGRRLRGAGDAEDSFGVSAARDGSVEDDAIGGEDRRVEVRETTAVGCGIAAGDEDVPRPPTDDEQPLTSALVDHRAKGDARRTRRRRVEGLEVAGETRRGGLSGTGERARAAAALEKDPEVARRAGQPRDERRPSAAKVRRRPEARVATAARRVLVGARHREPPPAESKKETGRARGACQLGLECEAARADADPCRGVEHADEEVADRASARGAVARLAQRDRPGGAGRAARPRGSPPPHDRRQHGATRRP